MQNRPASIRLRSVEPSLVRAYAQRYELRSCKRTSMQSDILCHYKTVGYANRRLSYQLNQVKHRYYRLVIPPQQRDEVHILLSLNPARPAARTLDTALIEPQHYFLAVSA